jgi:phosphoglycolate phosphatase
MERSEIRDRSARFPLSLHAGYTSPMTLTPMPYKLAIFDLDGTLSDSFPWFLRIVNVVADRHGVRRIKDHEIETVRGKGAREIVKFFQVPAWKLPIIARDMRRIKAAQLDEIPLFPGVDRLLQELTAKGVATAIVSSDSEENVRRALGPENARLISHYACGASIFGKAQKFRRVLKLAGVAAADAICIGDEIRDIEAARRAGIAFGAVTWGYATAQALRARKPEEVFASMDDMIARLAPEPGCRSAAPISMMSAQE